METLFDKEEMKSVRKLAELANHEQPVNCVRWNIIGTFFASGGDDGRAILWEFKGYKIVSKSQDIFQNGYQGSGMPVSQEDFKNHEEVEDKIETREDWQAKKIWRNHQSKFTECFLSYRYHRSDLGTRQLALCNMRH
jgi:WD40 repeat protein